MKNMRSTREEILLVHSGHRNNVLHSLISHVAVKRFPFSFLWCFCSNRDTVFQNNTFCRNRQTCHVLLLKKKKMWFPTFKDFFCRFHNFCSKTRCLKPEMSNSCLQRLSSIYLFFLLHRPGSQDDSFPCGLPLKYQKYIIAIYAYLSSYIGQ